MTNCQTPNSKTSANPAQINVSRRSFLGGSATALLLSVGLPTSMAKLQAKTGAEIRH